MILYLAKNAKRLNCPALMGNRLSYPEVDLSGRVAIVTGGNSGIGYDTAKGLAAMGAHTFIACRSRERAEEVLESSSVCILRLL